MIIVTKSPVQIIVIISFKQFHRGFHTLELMNEEGIVSGSISKYILSFRTHLRSQSSSYVTVRNRGYKGHVNY